MDMCTYLLETVMRIARGGAKFYCAGIIRGRDFCNKARGPVPGPAAALLKGIRWACRPPVRAPADRPLTTPLRIAKPDLVPAILNVHT